MLTNYIVEDRGYDTPCWIWKGTISCYGYAIVSIRSHPYGAHKVSYERSIGPVPKGLVLDHLCKVRRCINPYHLEPVTNEENILRGKNGVLSLYCPSNHYMSPQNTYWKAQNGIHYRRCKTCIKIRNAATHLRRVARKLALADPAHPQDGKEL